MSVRILHTSDWHLGKKLFQVERLTEQDLFLTWLSKEITEKKITHLLIAGDIFDTPNPPDKALSTYFKFLREVSEKNIQVYIIAGNHDSGRFIEAPKEFLKKENIHIVGKLNSLEFEPKEHQFEISEYFQLNILPYFRTKEIQDLPWYEKPEQFESEANKEALLNTIEKLVENITNSQKKNILMAHHLFGSFFTSESEQSLNLSGVNSIPLSLFKENYEYLALGHIHKPQIVSNEKPLAIYSGSPIAFRFSEIHQKKYSLLTIEDKNLKQEWVEIPSFRDLIRIEAKSSTWRETIKEKLTLHSNVSNTEKILLDLDINVDEVQPGLKREILSFLENYPVTLMGLKIKVQTESENSRNALNLEQNIQDIFKDYYQSIYPGEDVPQELLETFNLIQNKNMGLT
ncbi:MAG: exonuclease SbcCD subunit D [Oligoflexia bacterium]|nr:exonuclease SbcCD subunit D [Oligoflexia bacterium]